MSTWETFLADNHFPTPLTVRGRSSVADLFRSGARCGVYVLIFENDDLYVGQATDVTRRYAQHLCDRPDIAKIAFKRTRKDRLNFVERELINACQLRGLPLRNIALTNMPFGESDLDLVIPRAEQDAWLNGEIEFEQSWDERPDLSELARKTEHRMTQFLLAQPPQTLATFLQTYALEILPAAPRTELGFWCVTLLSSCADRQRGMISRVNVNWQEVLTMGWGGGQPSVKLQAARSVIEGSAGRELPLLSAKYSWLEWADSPYVAGGADQIMLYAPVRHAVRLLRDMQVRKALRLQVLRLMRKGPCAYSRFHCSQMADLMFGNSLPQSVQATDG